MHNNFNNKSSLLFVGAFPPASSEIVGGNVTACRSLLDAGLADYFDLILFDITQKSIPPPPLFARLPLSILRSLKFFQIVILKRPQFVLLFTSNGASFLEKTIMGLFARIFGSTVVLFPRAGKLIDDSRKNLIYKGYVKHSVNFSSIILCQEKTWLKFFSEDLNIKIDKLYVLRNWSANHSLLKIGEERKYNKKTKVRILFLAWVSESKGIFDLLEAFKLLKNEIDDVVLDIVGNGAAMSDVRTYINKNFLTESINIHGWLFYKEKENIIKDADIFCLPSHREGLPNSLIEAMASGLASVATNVGNIPDLLINNENGIIVKPKDFVSLKNQLKNLIVDEKMREYLGRNGYKVAKEKYNTTNAVSDLVGILNKYPKTK